jgi:PTH2 family peptidyl-tRNA hydrolase
MNNIEKSLVSLKKQVLDDVSDYNDDAEFISGDFIIKIESYNSFKKSFKFSIHCNGIQAKIPVKSFLGKSYKYINHGVYNRLSNGHTCNYSELSECPIEIVNPIKKEFIDFVDLLAFDISRNHGRFNVVCYGGELVKIVDNDNIIDTIDINNSPFTVDELSILKYNITQAITGKRVKEKEEVRAKFYDSIGKDLQRDTKQVIVMRTDLGMRKGKMIAQGAHASLAVFTREYANKTQSYTRQWLDNNFAKICVGTDSEESLDDLVKQAKDAGMPVMKIIDCGRTEFGGVPTATCIAIGPYWSDEIDKITGDLKLL